MEEQLIHSERQELTIQKHRLQSALLLSDVCAQAQSPVCEMLPDSLGFPWQRAPTFPQRGGSEPFNLRRG